jgi:hypothetical protein
VWRWRMPADNPGEGPFTRAEVAELVDDLVRADEGLTSSTTTSMPAVTTIVTEYRVSLLPDDQPEGWPYSDYQVSLHTLSLYVRRRRGDRWVVANCWDECLTVDGSFSQESRWEKDDQGAVGRIYGNSDGWEDTHHFDLETALRLAHQWAPAVEANGKTALNLLLLCDPARPPTAHGQDGAAS